MYLGKAGQKRHSAHLGLNGGFNFVTSCEEVNFRVPSPFQQLPWGRRQHQSRAGVGRSCVTWINRDREAGPAEPPPTQALSGQPPWASQDHPPDSTWQPPAWAMLNRAPRPGHSQLVTTILTHASQRQDFRLLVGVDDPRISSASALCWEAG